jgi:hypothetical protein
MSAILVTMPFQVFTDNDGNPLESGYVYIGQENLNPITTPISVYWDEAMTIPAAQPLRTTNGFLSRNGRPSNIFTAQNYSVLVQDRAGVLLYSSLNTPISITESSLPWVDASAYGPSKNDTTVTAAMAYASTAFGASAKYALLIKRGGWTISGNLTIPENVQLIFENGAVLNIATGVTVTYNGPDIQATLTQIFSLSGTGVFLFEGPVKEVYPQWWGAVGDGVSNDTVAFTAAQLAATPRPVFVTNGTYLITGSLTGSYYSMGGVTISGGTVAIVDLGFQDGDFDTTVTPNGEPSKINLSDSVLTVSPSVRGSVRYKTATSVTIICPKNILMSGFRFFGQPSKGRAPVFPLGVGGPQSVSLSSNLGAESTAHLDGWYAVFAVANNGDSAPVFKLMPALRVGSVAGSVITLCSAKEGIHSNTATSYAWSSTDNLAGVECLVINETIDSRANGFSGRITNITENTTTTITLDTIGAIDAFDWILPAPPGFSHFSYQCMFYYETPGDVRNISDSGNLVRAKMVNTSDPNFVGTGQVGSLPAPVEIRFGGYISPLATAVLVKESASLSTASTGSYVAYYDIDGSQHVVNTVYDQKEGTGTYTMVRDQITIPFVYKQSFFYSNGGSLVALRSAGKMEITGWIEN